MKPTLTHRGVLLAVVTTVTLVSGALLVAWPLVAVGLMQLSILLAAHLLFAHHVALFRQKLLEFAWWVPASRQHHGAIEADHPLDIRLLFRNRSPVSLRDATVSLVGNETLSFAQRELRIALPPQNEQHYTIQATPHATGNWFLQGAMIRVYDRLGLFALHAYFPNRLAMRVYPPATCCNDRRPFRPQTGAAHERAGPRLLRQRGIGSDLRELRDHQAGDPFKRIAWKATARSRRLIVREFESEVLLTLQVVLDISPSMRAQQPLSATKLERGIRLSASLARAALDLGDRVGLWTFDFRPYRHVTPSDGVAQMRRILDLLLELHQVVDEDLTDLTDAQLYSLVARYLAHQEGPDLRLSRAPEYDSSDWEGIVIGARGESIDADALVQAARASLARQARKQAATRLQRHLTHPGSYVQASDEALALLRVFCRFRGIELPYRRDLPLQRKHQGLTQSLVRASASQATRMIVLVTDLLDIGDQQQFLSTLQLCRRRRQAVSVVLPLAGATTATAPDEAAMLAHFVQLQEQQATAALRRKIMALGVPVILLAEADGLHSIVQSLVGQRTHHATLRRAAR
jgi:uncharacterized protein (DUF58 family)